MSDKCSCTQITSQSDCNSNSLCLWTSIIPIPTSGPAGTCATQTNIRIPTYCDSVSLVNCNATLGCANVNNKCVTFSGCTSYVYTTFKLCQGVSTKCQSNGTQCVLIQSCNSYSKTQCTTLISNSGSGTCKWLGTQCIDQICSDASSSYNSSEACIKFIPGCVTTGKGCASALGLCSSYTGDLTTCLGYIGTDGSCKGQAHSTNCIAQDCSDASVQFNTNQQCQLINPLCITNGKGCTQVLSLCSSYQGDCNGYIGSDGICIGSQICKAMTCQDNQIATTNMECAKFLPGCVTTGYGCVSVLPKCSSFSNLTVPCTKYIGSDGPCEASLNSTACRVRQCSEGKYTTDAECNKYLSGCITNGQNCVSALIPCSQYTNNCESYIGSDGNCMTVNTLCAAKICSTMQSSSNTICQQYSWTCISNGIICINSNTCPNTTNLLACTFTNGCSFQNQCVDQSQCINYTTKSQCLMNPQFINNMFQRQCLWINDSECVNDKCSNYTNCSLLQGCSYNGVSCIESSLDCTHYVGTSADCRSFKAVNNTQPCYDPILGYCTIKTCQMYYSNQVNNTLCNKFLNGCIHDGNISCVNQYSTCSAFIGTASTCSNFTGSSDSLTLNQPCFSNSLTPGSCRAKTCADCSFQTGDADCNQCVKGCISSRRSSAPWCISIPNLPSDQMCSSQNMGMSSCKQLSFTASCTKYNNICKTYTKGLCSTYQIYNNGSQTKNYLFCQGLLNTSSQACIYPGYGSVCAESSSGGIFSGCTAFMLKYSTIQQNIIYCYQLNPTCTAGQTTCISGFSCSQMTPLQISDCTNIKCLYNINNGVANCAIDKGNSCTTYPLAGMTPTNKVAYCQSLYNQSTYPLSLKCLYDAKNSNFCANNSCVLRVPVVYSDCNVNLDGSPLTNCYFNGISCSVYTTCAQIVVKAFTLQQAALLCNASKDSDGSYCSFNTATPYSCQPNTQQRACNTYTTYGTNDVINWAFCIQLRDPSGNCLYSTLNQNTCASNPSVTTCDGYINLPLQNDGPNALFCSQQNKVGSNCFYISGSTACTAMPSVSDCASFPIVNASVSTLQSVCQSLQTSTSIGCDYNGNTSKCITKSVCKNYIAAKASDCNVQTTEGDCIYDGTNICKLKEDNCSDYEMTSAASALTNCPQLKNTSGVTCFQDPLNKSKCTEKICATAPNDDCQNFMSECVPDTSSPCQLLQCADNTSAITDYQCAQFRNGCVYNGIAGCIEASSQCSAFSGTTQTCQQRSGLNGTQRCSQLVDITIPTPCIPKTCMMNTTAVKDSDCEYWYPSLLGTNQFCVWNGSIGCVSPQNCSQFNASATICSIVTALDGPCKRITESPGQCSPVVCEDAPNTLTTNAQCSQFKTGCKTNGYGCSSSMQCANYQSRTSCLANNCGWTTSCASSIQQPCSTWTSASVCRNYNCYWNNGCRAIQCTDISSSYTSDQQCSAILNSCTTTGSGCITKGTCSSYQLKSVCNAASSTDPAQKCIWDVSNCRPITCEDYVGNTDSSCNVYGLTKCKSNGQNCFTPPYKCNIFITQQSCLLSSSNPCLWVGNQCLDYTACTDIKSPSYNYCQQAHSQCTTNGIQCISIDYCANYTNKFSCVTGIDGQCGFLPSGLCVKFNSCLDAIAYDNLTCQAYNLTCYSDGNKCITQDKCQNYLTQTACSNLGTDGICQWGQACSLRQCSDATLSNSINTKTDTGCQAFQAAKTCTTNGIACIDRQQCSYYNRNSCFTGTDGKCIYTSNGCRVQQCSDYTYKQSSDCSSIMQTCISNGTSCIAKAACQTYTDYESCSNGGIDGICAFTQGASSLKGTCKLVSQCSDANLDQLACQKFNCLYQNGNCQSQTCASRQIGSVCRPVSVNSTAYQICIPASSSNTTCIPGDSINLTSTTCYLFTQGTHTYNNSTCSYCGTTINNTNTNTSTSNNQTTTINNTNTTNNQTQTNLAIKVTISVLLILI